MNSEDDPRSIDWAPKKIEAIERDLANLREIFGDDRKVRERHEQAISSRVWDLEQAEKRLTHLERQSEDLAREVGNQFAEMSRRISGMEDRHRELVKQSADEIEVLSDRVAELQGAIASRVREELSAGFRDLEPEPEFSAPIGRAGDIEDRTHLRGTGRPARHGGIFALSEMRVEAQPGGVVPEVSFSKGSMASVFEGAWERGYEAGRRAAVDEAESRVRAYMENHFSTGTINGVLNEITAVVSTKTGNDARRRLDLGEPQYAGHLYRSGCCNREPIEHIGLHREYLAEINKNREVSETRVIAKLAEMGWSEGSPAMLGVVNALRGTKPIKDQPQG